jgi:hypothetical protein
MAEDPSLPAASSQEIHAHLHAISELLRRPQRLDASAQAALADLVDELDNAFNLGKIANDEAVRLAASASHFAAAIHRGEPPSVLEATRARLEKAAIAAESSAPLVAGLARRFIDALANVGI